jgi:hypothetical protein
MTRKLFRPGGDFGVRELGGDRYQMNISLPKDGDGRLARECPDEACSPGYFKVTPGTGNSLRRVFSISQQALALQVGQMEAFYLSSYCPELNQEERLNADLKHVIRTKAPVRTKAIHRPLHT